ncbi:unnamed protein product [Lathyrus sativus]|nr:unnamed protein product [Lathyrus sativus]
MMCVTSVQYSVVVNIDSVGPIQLGRDLRQGNTLSPYRFILISEGMYAFIEERSLGGSSWIPDLKGASSCVPYAFVDDCFLFCRANIFEVSHLMEVLKTYADAFGQEINLTKSEVFFSRSISRLAQDDIARVMGVRHVLGTRLYLGLSSMNGKSKKGNFCFY